MLFSLTMRLEEGKEGWASGQISGGSCNCMPLYDWLSETKIEEILSTPPNLPQKKKMEISYQDSHQTRHNVNDVPKSTVETALHSYSIRNVYFKTMAKTTFCTAQPMTLEFIELRNLTKRCSIPDHPDSQTYQTHKHRFLSLVQKWPFEPSDMVSHFHELMKDLISKLPL